MTGAVVGNFKILNRLGEGGMGAVSLGLDLMLDRQVALKMLRPELSRDPEIVKRFRSEAVTLARINHPRVATLFSFFRHQDDFFMVMEYVQGQTLAEVLSRGAMTCERAVSLFCQALDGVDYAHKLDIVHRDLKPANLMLLPNGSVKVMDFGIARVLGSSRMTRTGHLVGTVEYMSPEQIQGRETDARSDIYSLGIVLFEMLTGRAPFENDSDYELMRAHMEDLPPRPRQFAPHIPQPIEAAILRSLSKKPSDRFASAAEFRSVLLKGLSMPDSPALEASPEPAKRPPKAVRQRLNPARRSAAVKLYVFAIVLLATGGLLVFFLVRERPPTKPTPQPASSIAEPAPVSPDPAPVLPTPVPDASPPVIQPDVKSTLEEDRRAARERERRRVAAEKAEALKKATEKALDLR